MPHSKETTQQRIFDALESTLSEHGFSGLTIRQVASKAGINKLSIYRKFQTIDNLLLQYNKQCLWPENTSRELELATIFLPSRARQWTNRTSLPFQTMRRHKAHRLMLLKAITSTDSLADALHRQQEKQWLKWLDEMNLPDPLEQQPIVALLVGGLSYLTLLAHLDKPMLGIDLRSQQGWQQIEKALDSIYQSIYKTTLAE